jgi:hypothetical protein
VARLTATARILSILKRVRKGCAFCRNNPRLREAG